MHNIIKLPALLFLIVGIISNLWADDSLPHQKEPFDDILVAGQPNLEQLEYLADEGFTTVINLRMPGEFDDFDEAAEVQQLGMRYVHIPLKNIAAIVPADALALHEAITTASGPVLLHCTVGWRAGGLLAIERYLVHDVSRQEAIEIAAEAHMSHATGDVEGWIDDNG